ncbi:transcriptional adapter 1 [Notothenia coriiceps]|uniref:Transcriptional adapter 1 n=1 Tax=Notothenia coriiceps TaxID=8208 RepID=A0A6I9Q6K3_9TELE|nr:PREDICTED: transcriptional adapter 1 [Notothenia coriiceps]
MDAMAAHASELEIAKKNLTDAIGDNVKHYWANLKLWFKQKISKEEFDIEARRLLAQENVHIHNDFLLAILTRCQIIVSTPEGAGPLQWQGGSASKPGKPKGKKKCSSRQKFDHRFQPQNPLSAAQPFSPREVGGEEEELRLSAHTLLLPTRGQLEARMMVTAFELGLDNITEDAVSSMTHAVEFLMQVHHGVMPSHTMYALNMERILSRLWHPSHEELEQDHVHRQRLAAKEGLLVC